MYILSLRACTVLERPTNLHYNQYDAKATVVTATTGDTVMVACPLTTGTSSTRWQHIPAKFTAHDPSRIGHEAGAINALSISHATVTNGWLVLTDVQVGHAGRWVCEVNSSLARSEATLEVMRSPEVDIRPSMARPRLGEPITLNCSARFENVGGKFDFDNYQVVWTKDAVGVKFDERVQMRSNGRVLHITNFRFSDNGMYQCFLAPKNRRGLQWTFGRISLRIARKLNASVQFRNVAISVFLTYL